MKKLLILLFVLILTQNIFSQQGKGLSNAVDNSGYCYVTGYSINSDGGQDILVTKYDLAGDTLWTKTFSGDNSLALSQGKEINVASDGSVYVVGTIGNVNTGSDVVLIKLSAAGDIIWQRVCTEINSDYEDKAFGIAVDDADNAFITGYSTQNGVASIFTAMYNSDESFGWAAFNAGPDNLTSQGNEIALDHNGNVIVTGFTTTSATGIDIITLKYGPNGGDPIWVMFYNGTANSEDKAFGIAVDEADNVYITGYVTNNLDNPNIDIALLKYSSSGNLEWAKSWDGGYEDKAFGIVTDGTDALYITGYSTTADAGMNYITLRYDLVNGDKIWQTLYDGTGSDDKANSLGLITDNGVVVGVVVTGQSVGTDNTNDYETILYTSDEGTSVDSSRYTGTASNDIATQLAVTTDGTIYVTGGSELIVNRKQTIEVKTQQFKFNMHKNLGSINSIPFNYALYQNYPNPFNPSTTIRFDLAKGTTVKLSIYDILGREVAVPINQFMTSGTHEISYISSNLASGTYFYELKTDQFRDVKKMILIK